MAKYTFDEDLVRRLGWNGKVFARFATSGSATASELAERHHADLLCTRRSPSTSYMTWLAWDNPNYNVAMIGGSLGLAS